MNYKQAYRRYEISPHMIVSPGLSRSGRKPFAVHKNMESGGLGPAAGYYFERVAKELRTKANPRKEPFGTNSSPEFRPKPQGLPFSHYSKSYDKPYFPQLHPSRKPDPPPSHPDPPDSDPPPQYQQSASEAQYPSPHPQPDTKQAQPTYESEIDLLKEKLRRKDEEIAKYLPGRPMKDFKPKAKASIPEPESFDRINKALWDKQVSREARKLTVQALDYQLSEKEMMRQWETLQKEKEQMTRLEHLRRLREIETQERLTQVSRAKIYREHLDMQRKIKSELSLQEGKIARMSLPAETAPPIRDTILRRSYQPQTEFEKVALEFYDQSADGLTATSLAPLRLTKKAPKTITFNPITGIVRDTSIYLQGDIPRPILRSYLPEPRNQDHAVPDYSQLPAFQQPFFTAKNPKVISTDPISMKLPPRNYRTEEFYANTAKFFGVDSDPQDQGNYAGTQTHLQRVEDR